MGLLARAESGFMRLHAALYIHSDGRVGRRMIGVPTLLLRTTGRRSGLPRTVALVYAEDDNRYVMVASNHGWDRPPAWFVNLQAQPRVNVQVGRVHVDGVASVVTSDDPHYSRLWSLMNAANHDRYDGYQSKTSRPIPLVVVSPS